MNREEAIKVIKENLFTKRGRLNPHFSKLYERINNLPWFKEIRPILNQYLTDKPIDAYYDKLRIYCLLNNLEYKTYPLCNNCKKNEVNFRDFGIGFAVVCEKCFKENPNVLFRNKIKPKQSNQNQNQERKTKPNSYKFNTTFVQDVFKQVAGNNGLHSRKAKKFLDDIENIEIIQKKMQEIGINWIPEISTKTLNEILFCIDNNISKQPLCTVCGKNPVRFKSFLSGYSKVCSDKICQSRIVPKQNRNQKPINWKKLEILYGKTKDEIKKEWEDRKKQGMIKKYGTTHHMLVQDVKDRITEKSYITRRKNVIERFKDRCGFFNFEYSSEELETLVQDRNKTTVQIICKRCKTKTTTSIYTEVPMCPVCDKYSSRCEKLFRMKLSEKYSEIIETNKRFLSDGTRNYEIDLYLPNHKIGIEINGLATHCTTEKETWFPSVDRELHYNKSILAAKKGITLFHFWEDLVYRNPNLCVSLVLKEINQYNIDVNIDDYYVVLDKISTNTEILDFLNENSILLQDEYINFKHICFIEKEKNKILCGITYRVKDNILYLIEFVEDKEFRNYDIFQDLILKLCSETNIEKVRAYLWLEICNKPLESFLVSNLGFIFSNVEDYIYMYNPDTNKRLVYNYRHKDKYNLLYTKRFVFDFS